MAGPAEPGLPIFAAYGPGNAIKRTQKVVARPIERKTEIWKKLRNRGGGEGGSYVNYARLQRGRGCKKGPNNRLRNTCTPPDGE